MIRRTVLLLVLAGGLASGAAAPEDARAPFDHVIVISIDGLRSDALLVEPATLPNLDRLRREGAATINARTDADFTTTMPNHVCMVTGRDVLGPAGHGWQVNDIIDGRDVLPDQDERYVAGLFDVAHDHGVRTVLFISKPKLRILRLSWDGTRGREDRVGSDDGRDKIDLYKAITADRTPGETTSRLLTHAVLRELDRPHARRLVFVHYRHPDDAGHKFGWDMTPGSPYLRSVASVDVEIGRLLARIEGDEALRGRVAVIVTTDHGGGVPRLNHKRADLWVNYVIPIIVWTGDDGTTGADLYALNAATRADPGLGRSAGPGAAPPIRTGDVANLALDLLGLPPVPGSTINAAQDLDVGVRTPPATTAGSTAR